MAKVFIGIDLGTTYSAAAYVDDTGRAGIIHNQDGSNITPSVISFRDNGDVEVGEEARRTLGLDADTVGRFKRDMGTGASYTACGKTFSPVDLSAFVLRKLKDDAEKSLGKEVAGAIITVPANFNQEARSQTVAAAKQAGLNVLGLINEPTAAALHYANHDKADLEEGFYAVYDLGGGTFDVSVLDISIKNGNVDSQVKSSNGVAKLGGDDFDTKLQAIVSAKYKELADEDLDPEDFTKSDAESEKKALSKRDKVKCRVARKNIEITREEFELAISSLITQCEMLCEATVEEAGIGISDLKGVFLVGGFEQEKFIPSISCLIGMRSSRGIEFAAGPNLSLSGSSLVIATGVTFRSDEINFPINIAYSTSQSGGRFSLLFGFNIRDPD